MGLPTGGGRVSNPMDSFAPRLKLPGGRRDGSFYINQTRHQANALKNADNFFPKTETPSIMFFRVD
jgi:hypothetical protein